MCFLQLDVCLPLVPLGVGGGGREECRRGAWCLVCGVESGHSTSLPNCRLAAQTDNTSGAAAGTQGCAAPASHGSVEDSELPQEASNREVLCLVQPCAHPGSGHSGEAPLAPLTTAAPPQQLGTLALEGEGQHMQGPGEVGVPEGEEDAEEALEALRRAMGLPSSFRTAPKVKGKGPGGLGGGGDGGGGGGKKRVGSGGWAATGTSGEGGGEVGGGAGTGRGSKRQRGKQGLASKGEGATV